MGRTYKKVIGGRSYQNYNTELLENAIRDVSTKKKTIRAAAKVYNVPKSTICDKIRKIHVKKVGGQTLLSSEEEKRLSIGIEKAADWGFPLTQYDVRVIVKHLDRKGITIKNFKENLPGIEWIKSFLSRHHGLTTWFCQNIKRYRAQVSETALKEYFEELRVSLENVDPTMIVNYDETNFCDDPGNIKVICKRGSKHCDRIMDSSKSSISVMMSASASGKLLPPFVVYKAKHRYQEWEENGPNGCGYSVSKSGWFESRTFLEWFRQIAIPYFRQKDGPKILIGDNLSSHLTLEVIEECARHDVRFIFLPPNSTHLCQPLDVAFFAPLKKAWRRILTEWKTKRKGPFQKRDFPQLLQNTLQAIEANVKKNILSGFRACGISPFDPQQVLKRLPQKLTTQEGLQDCEIDKSLLEFLKENRTPTTQTKPNRRKKVNVPAGRPVNLEDLQPELVSQPLESLVNIPSSSGLQESRISQPIPYDDSDSDSQPLAQLVSKETRDRVDKSCEHMDISDSEGEEEESNKTKDCIEDKNITVNDFTLVKLPVQNSARCKFYIAKILDIEGENYLVSFLRNNKSRDDNFFHFPNIPDEGIVAKLEIVQKVSYLQFRRDRYKFTNLPDVLIE